MKKEELKIWFWDKFYSCYPVEHISRPGNIILMYDEAFIRDMKLASILNEKVKYPDKVTGQWLFYIDYKNGYFYVNHNEIWTFLKQNYSPNNIEVKHLIIGWLEEHDKMKPLTPETQKYWQWSLLEEHDKMEHLTPKRSSVLMTMELEEHDKLKILNN